MAQEDKQLKLKGVCCFLFHDKSSIAQGYDVDTAGEVFGEIARITVERSFPVMN